MFLFQRDAVVEIPCGIPGGLTGSNLAGFRGSVDFDDRRAQSSRYLAPLRVLEQGRDSSRGAGASAGTILSGADNGIHDCLLYLPRGLPDLWR